MSVKSNFAFAVDLLQSGFQLSVESNFAFALVSHYYAL